MFGDVSVLMRKVSAEFNPLVEVSPERCPESPITT